MNRAGGGVGPFSQGGHTLRLLPRLNRQHSENCHGRECQHRITVAAQQPAEFRHPSVTGVPLCRDAHCGGSGVFPVLRLHPLLRPVRLHLYSAGTFRLSALRTTRKLFSAARLLDHRRSPWADHGAISAGDDSTPRTLNFGQGEPLMAATGVAARSSVLRSVLESGRHPMRPGAVLLCLAIGMSVNITLATTGHSAPYLTRCSDAWNFGGCRYGGGRCYVTMTGLGVCVPGPSASWRYRDFLERRRP